MPATGIPSQAEIEEDLRRVERESLTLIDVEEGTYFICRPLQQRVVQSAIVNTIRRPHATSQASDSPLSLVLLVIFHLFFKER